MEISKMYLTMNTYSRPGIAMKQVKGIVIHYVGNPESTALANRNYFNRLKDQQTTKPIYASSHYIVGLEGEIIACVPEEEVAYHASSANSDHIGIEVCHPDNSGKFSTVTYEALIGLIIDICNRYKLNPVRDVIRHYDVTGKDCPRYYVKNVDAWEQLKKDADKSVIDKIRIELNGVEKEVEVVNVEGFNFVKLRDLADDKIKVAYDDQKKLPIIKIRQA
ncbi:MAG: peptidoglycan recognition family protein [Niameybacter sp.]